MVAARSNSSDARPLSPSSIALDSACLLFAAWTLFCHAVVFSGGSFWMLLTLVAVAGAAGAGTLAFAVKRWGGRRVANRLFGVAQFEHESRPSSARARIAAIPFAVGIVAIYAWTESYVVFWWMLLAYCALMATSPFEFDRALPKNVCAHQEARLWLLSAMCVLVTLVAHRSSVDDSFYINLAVGAADFPNQQLLAFDTMLGIEGLPITLPIYRVHAFELLGGAISLLTGIPAVWAIHVVLSGIAAILVPIAFAQLFRMLGVSRWLWATVTVAVFFIVDGGSNYSNFALVGLHHGKAIFLTILVPALIAFAIRYARRPTWTHWTLLAATVIGSVGMTSTAIWVTPAVTGLALCSMWKRDRTRAIALGLLPILYPVVLGLALMESTRQAIPTRFLQVADGAGIEVLEFTISSVLQTGFHRWAILVLGLLAWPLVQGAVGARMVAVFWLGFTLVFLNPYIATTIANQVTSAANHWRIFWVLPLPAMLGLVGVSTMGFGKNTKWSLARFAVCVGLFCAIVPPYTTLSSENRVSLHRPTPKVSENYYVAKRIRDHVEPATYVLAGHNFNLWMTTLNGHPFPLMTKGYYFEELMSKKEKTRRHRLVNYVDGRNRPRRAVHLLEGSIRNDSLAAVAVNERAPWREEIEDVLLRNDYSKVETYRSQGIWLRKTADEPQ